MQTKNLVQRGNTLQFTCKVVNGCSPKFSICGCATFQVHVKQLYGCDVKQIFVRFFNNCHGDDFTYSITLSSNELCVKKKSFLSDDGTWHLIMENCKKGEFDMSVVMDTVHISSFEALYDDTELTDFELRGEDGSVKVHKAVLAASSDIFKQMLSGSWRETTEGHVSVPGTSAQTLQDFKDCICLHTLPNTGLKQILLLASYYMIPNLEQKCVNKLMNSLTSEDACDMLEFAAKHKVTRLVLAIVHSGHSGHVNVNHMRECFLNCYKYPIILS